MRSRFIPSASSPFSATMTGAEVLSQEGTNGSPSTGADATDQLEPEPAALTTETVGDIYVPAPGPSGHSTRAAYMVRQWQETLTQAQLTERFQRRIIFYYRDGQEYELLIDQPWGQNVEELATIRIHPDGACQFEYVDSLDMNCRVAGERALTRVLHRKDEKRVLRPGDRIYLRSPQDWLDLPNPEERTNLATTRKRKR